MISFTKFLYCSQSQNVIRQNNYSSTVGNRCLVLVWYWQFSSLLENELWFISLIQGYQFLWVTEVIVEWCNAIMVMVLILSKLRGWKAITRLTSICGFKIYNWKSNVSSIDLTSLTEPESKLVYQAGFCLYV